MKPIIGTKKQLPAIIQAIHSGIDKAINQLFGDWTSFSNELEFE